MLDADRRALVRDRLFTGVIGDSLDAVGRHHQFLPPTIRGLTFDMVCVGRAMPVLTGDTFGKAFRPFGRLTEAVDQLEDGEVYLVRTGRIECASWGEILTTAARLRGAVGAVTDGYHRDTAGILAQQWPVFSAGSYAQDLRSRGVVLDYRVSIEIAGTPIDPGDLVFGDRDGVVIIPRAVEDEVLEHALAKVSAENQVLEAVRGGSSATAAFEDRKSVV